MLFPFGYGLSYTIFTYSNLKLSAETIDENDTLTISFEITNVGDYDGAETAQVYVRDLEATNFIPEKELKAFKKVFLKKGESKTVTLDLRRDAFAFYNVRTGDWCVESGDFEILVGSSSRDILLRAAVQVKAPAVEIPDYKEKAPVYYSLADTEEIPLEQFEALMGRKIALETPIKKGELDLNSTVSDLGVSTFGKIFRWAVARFSPMVLPKGAPEFEKNMVREGAMSLPVRNIFSMTNGAVTYEATLGLLTAFNGKTLKGLYRFIKAMSTNKSPKKTDIYR